MRTVLFIAALLCLPGWAAAQKDAHKDARVTAAANLVRYLEAEGVTKVFGVPGEETLHLMDALNRSKKIRFVLSGNEQGASLMATGYARATGKLGVALSTLGPGATNLVTGAANALSENIKLLLITGQGPVKRPMGYHQKLPLTRVFEPVTRLSLEAGTAGSVVSTARKLVAAAHKNPGPVHLSLPSDVAARRIKPVTPTRATRPRPVKPKASAVARAAALIKGARFPVIIAGDGVLQDRADRTASGVLAFARAHNIPVVPSAIAKGMFPWKNELVLPPLDAFAKGRGADVVRKADLIISVGYHPTETFEPQNFNPRGKTKVVHLSSQKLPAEHRIKGMDPQAEVTSNLVRGLAAVHRKIKGHRAPETAARAAAKVRREHSAQLAKISGVRSQAAPLKPQQVMAELRRALDSGARKGDRNLVFGDVGLNKGYLTQWLQVNRPGEVMVPNGMSTMGVSLPAAVGAKLARPDLKVVSVSGDGGLMMNVQELATAASNKLPLVHLVLVDQKLGLIENHQRRNALTPSGVKVPRLNIKSLAKGMGARGHMVKRASQIAPLIQRALQRKGPTLIGIPVDYSEAHARADKIAQKSKVVPRTRAPRYAPTARGAVKPRARTYRSRPLHAARRIHK